MKQYGDSYGRNYTRLALYNDLVFCDWISFLPANMDQRAI